jgi:hypothetical protein
MSAHDSAITEGVRAIELRDPAADQPALAAEPSTAIA